MKIKNYLKIAVYTVMILLLAASCPGKKHSPVPAAHVEMPRYAGLSWPALAQLRTGGNPLWFELGQNGPELIESPDDASLSAFIPWPFAHYVIDMQVWDDFLVMAVNRDGFLVLGSAGDDSSAVLYRVSGDFWHSYTSESLFVWEHKPAVLLYRNDFFMEPIAPPLRPQVYVLDKTSAVPLAVSVPALENFPSDDPWEAEVLHRGSGGLWYFRMKEKGKIQAEAAYFKTPDLSETGTRISIGEWMNSGTSEIPETVSRHLTMILNNCSGVSLVKVLSSDFKEPRFFAPDSSSGEGLLYAYSREADQLTIAIFPDGQGFFLSEKEPEIQLFTLPPLPEAFVYTGIALFGKILTASWEEQQDASIGAAGFMVISHN